MYLSVRMQKEIQNQTFAGVGSGHGSSPCDQRAILADW